MSSSCRKPVVAALLAATMSSFPGVASATPVAGALAIKNAAPAQVESVQWRRGWRGPRAGFVPGAVVAGAVVGGAISAPYYNGYAYGPYYAAPYYTAAAPYPAPAYYPVATPGWYGYGGPVWGVSGRGWWGIGW